MTARQMLRLIVYAVVGYALVLAGLLLFWALVDALAGGPVL